MSKKYKHIMLDIETMGTANDSCIISIGAVKFDLETGETGDDFYVNIDLQSCLDLGLSVTGATIMWWLQQARKDLVNNTISIQSALLQFSKFCDGTYYIWGNSPRFDCSILANAYNKAGILIPWSFRLERDVRTLVSFNPEIKKNYEFLGVAHNAVVDCYKQIGYCSEIYKSLKK